MAIRQIKEGSKTMGHKQKFFTRAEAVGLVVDYEPANVVADATISLWAPDGQVFNGSGCHCDFSIDALTDTRGIDWPSALKQLEHIIAHGFSPCEDRPECEICDGAE
jgi:hypothetical protein